MRWFKNVVSKFVHAGSQIYGDASKAFDQVNHEVLFSKLMERNVPLALNHFLVSWYRSQRMHLLLMVFDKGGCFITASIYSLSQ